MVPRTMVVVLDRPFSLTSTFSFVADATLPAKILRIECPSDGVEIKIFGRYHRDKSVTEEVSLQIGVRVAKDYQLEIHTLAGICLI